MICDECETVAHCMKNGCVPKTAKKDEALKLALEALEGIHPGNMTPMAEEYWNKAITALREALNASLAQQPAPSQYGSPELQAMVVARAMEKNAAAQPAQQEPLTNEEITKAFNEAMAKRPKDASNAETNRLFARAIEAAHGIKEKNCD